MFCETLLDVLEKIPGDSRTQIGFIAYDSAVHFFNLAEGLSQPQMLTVSDVEGNKLDIIWGLSLHGFKPNNNRVIYILIY